MNSSTQTNCHPDMGSHIMMDLHNITNISLTDPSQMLEILESALSKTDCTICDRLITNYEENRGFSILFLLSESHLSVHTIPSKKCFSIDFYNCGMQSWNNLKIVEQCVCDYFGWKNASSTILIPRSKEFILESHEEREPDIDKTFNFKNHEEKQNKKEINKRLMQKQPSNPQKIKKPGIYDQMWQALIRPNNRVKYSVKDLAKSMQRQPEPHPCVLYLHGNSSSRLEGLSLLEYLIPHGIAVILMDFAGCGLSQGEYISLGFFEKGDAGLVLDYIKQVKNISKFGIWGRSMGASTGIQLGCMRSDVELVVADSSFVSVQMLCQEVAKRQYKLPKFAVQLAYYFIKKKIRKVANFELNDCNTLKAIQNPVHKPSILFLAAKGDQLIHYNHSVELFENYKGPKNILLFEGNHNSKRPLNILEEVSQYFRKSLFLPLKIDSKQLQKPVQNINKIPPKQDQDDFVPQNCSSSDSDKIPEEKKPNQNQEEFNVKISAFMVNNLEKEIFLLKQQSQSEFSKGGSTSVSDYAFLDHLSDDLSEK